MVKSDADPTRTTPTPAPSGAGPAPAAPVPATPAVELPFGTPLPIDRILTPTESLLVRRLVAFARSGGAGPFQADLWRALDTGLTGLGNIAEAIESYPSLRERRSLGGKERSLTTLVDSLVKGGE